MTKDSYRKNLLEYILATVIDIVVGCITKVLPIVLVMKRTYK